MNLFYLFFFFFFVFHTNRVLIKCTEHLLAEVKKENPKLLATGANIVGNVVIHPGAKVDPSSKVLFTIIVLLGVFDVWFFFFFSIRLDQTLQLERELLLVLEHVLQIQFFSIMLKFRIVLVFCIQLLDGIQRLENGLAWKEHLIWKKHLKFKISESQFLAEMLLFLLKLLCVLVLFFQTRNLPLALQTKLFFKFKLTKNKKPKFIKNQFQLSCYSIAFTGHKKSIAKNNAFHNYLN